MDGVEDLIGIGVGVQAYKRYYFWRTHDEVLGANTIL